MKKLLFALQGNSTKIFALQGNSTKKIIAGILLVVLMGILVGCPTEAPKEKKKSGDDGGGGPIVINGTADDWRTFDADTTDTLDDVRIVEYIGDDKTSIVIPTLVNGNKVVKIEGFDADGNAGIFRQKTGAKNATIKSVDMFNATHLKEITKYAFAYMDVLESVILPEGLKTIKFNAFENTALTSIMIPASVTLIDSEAFRSSGLTSIIIPASVKTIGDRAFNNCTNLAKLTLSEGLETIGQGAFSLTALTSIALPSTLKSIGDGIFYKTSLKTVIILRKETPLTTAGGTSIFGDTPIANAANILTTKIYYPKGADYQNAANWITYKDSTTWVEGTP